MKQTSLPELDKNFAQPDTGHTEDLRWRSATDRRFTVRGLPWFAENGKTFNRLPARAQKQVREPVWELSRCPAGARICFRTDSTRLVIRMENHHSAHMPHFAMTGSAGTFVYEGEPFRMKPWNMIVPAPGTLCAEKEIARDLPPRMRTFTVHLPAYSPLKSLRIGLDSTARLAAPPPCERSRPVVFYGTSITQGGCASTAGGDAVSTVGRLLNMDVVNLGFSGNGKGEPELARLIAEIDAEAFVLDYCANTGDVELKKTLPVFVRMLREAHPETPVILMTQIPYYSPAHNVDTRAGLERKRDVMVAHYAACRGKGDPNIHLIDGRGLLSPFHDLDLVDGAHPTSAGFARMAGRLAPQIAYILGL